MYYEDQQEPVVQEDDKSLQHPLVRQMVIQLRAVDSYGTYDTWSDARVLDPLVLTKSGIMVGLGETFDEVVEVMRDLANLKVDILTIGQYLQPSKEHLQIDRYYEPQEFDELKRIGLELGFKWVESGPLVRSSYRAEQQVRTLSQLNYIHVRSEPA